VLYVIIANDVPNSSAKRAATRPRHLEYIDVLKQQGRVVIAGPNPAVDKPDPGDAGMTGSVIIAEFESLKDAEAWVANDPYLVEGVFQSVTVKPFVKVLP